jgi:hypothetical protein
VWGSPAIRLIAGAPRSPLWLAANSLSPLSRRQPLRQRLLRELADVGAGGSDVEQRALDRW